MAKGNRMLRVSDSFSRYITSMQERLKKDTGKDFSQQDITAIIASQPPIIRVEARKRRNGTIFDF